MFSVRFLDETIEIESDDPIGRFYLESFAGCDLHFIERRTNGKARVNLAILADCVAPDFKEIPVGSDGRPTVYFGDREIRIDNVFEHALGYVQEFRGGSFAIQHQEADNEVKRVRLSIVREGCRPRPM